MCAAAHESRDWLDLNKRQFNWSLLLGVRISWCDLLHFLSYDLSAHLLVYYKLVDCEEDSCVQRGCQSAQTTQRHQTALSSSWEVITHSLFENFHLPPAINSHFTSTITVTVNLNPRYQPQGLNLICVFFVHFLLLQVQQRRRNMWATTTLWSNGIPPSERQTERKNERDRGDSRRCLVSCPVGWKQKNRRQKKKKRMS